MERLSGQCVAACERSQMLSVASRGMSPGSVGAAVEYVSADNSACKDIVAELSDELALEA